ncbi:MAG: PLP-dependent aminotransferase family protein [Pseudomonadota bacterium]
MKLAAPLPEIRLDAASNVPLFRQLYGALKEAILSGQIKPGAQLPPSRSLAATLKVSRQTVVNAYAQLLAEGYFMCTVGKGSFVSQNLPVRMERVRRREPQPATQPEPPQLSERGRAFANPRLPLVEQVGGARAFRTGMPALEAFPFDVWTRLNARRWRRPLLPLGYGDPAGFAPLRELLAAHLQVSRGMRCAPEQIIVTTGAQQALNLVAMLLTSAGDKVWMESPGYRGAAAAFEAAGLVACPVAVDGEGLCVEQGITQHPTARLAYVTPSHQYPLGVTMTLERRMALIAWAAQHKAWIVEDDYDSEYRYSGPVLASLQSLDRSGSVLYVGTLSKILFPGLRLGYLVVPPALVDAFRRGKAVMDRTTALMPQVVLADFIAGGHFHRQIKRTHALYDERRTVLVDALQSELGQHVAIGPSNAGLQLAVAFQRPLDDQAFAERAAAKGIEVRALSTFYLDQATQTRASGLLLGYSCVPPVDIRRGVAVLKGLL